jgi:hypothetical protein
MVEMVDVVDVVVHTEDCENKNRLNLSQGPSIQKKMTILFFVYFGTHNNKIHTFYKQTRVFVLIFSMLLFCFY